MGKNNKGKKGGSKSAAATATNPEALKVSYIR